MNIEEKIKKISEKFDTAEELISTDVKVLEEKTLDIKEHKDQYDPVDVMSAEIMADDFKFSRESLKETITYGRMMLEKITTNFVNDEEDTTKFTEISNSIISAVKIYSAIYKDFSNVLLNIKNIKHKGPGTVTNNLNIDVSNVEHISTTDLIARLKESS